MEYDKRIFSKNIIKYMNLAGENQSEVAAAIGVTKSSMSSYALGLKMPRMDKIQKLAEHFGVRVSDLVEEDGSGIETNSVTIPVLGKVPAGVPIEAVEEVLEYEEIPQSMAKTGEFFGLRVQGNSMYPLLYSGETIIIRKQNTAENGDIVVALIDNEDATVKRFKVIPDGVILEAENENYNSIFISKRQIENGKLQIVGKAVESRKKL